MSIKKTQKLIDLAKKGGNNADLYILQLIEDIENKLEKMDEKMPDFGMFLANVRGEDGVSIEEISIEDGILTIVNSEGEEFSAKVAGENGKDAEVTEELKNEIAELVKNIIEFPDYSQKFSAIENKLREVEDKKNIVEVKETTIEREVIPQEKIDEIKSIIPILKTSNEIARELEELEEEEKLSFNALKDVPNIKEIKDAISVLHAIASGGGNLEVFNSSGNKVGSGSGIQFIGATVTHNGNRAVVTVTGGGGGSSVSVNGVTVTDPDFVDSPEIEIVDNAGSVSFNLRDESIDEVKLDASVNASLDLADSALQAANISDTAYNATSWNGISTVAPSKNAIRDKIETMDAAIALNTAKVTNATHTGDVTGATTLTIANDAVTYAKMQNVSATARVLGRVTAGSGDVEEIVIDTDLSSVSANDDTIPSAKSTKTYVDSKARFFNISGVYNNTVGALLTRFVSLYGPPFTTLETAISGYQVSAYTLEKWTIKTGATQPATGSLVLTVYKNASPTSLTITVAAGSAAGFFSDTSNSASVAVGDTLSIQAVNNAITTSATVFSSLIQGTIA
jgi:hypothetical protein